MPRRIGYHKPAGRPDAAAVYRRQPHRLEDNRFYASAAWRKLRAAYLAAHPICQTCGRALAGHAHHKVPRKADPTLALDWDNLKALCQPCHNAEEIR